MPLEILYQDEWLLAINKPSGLLVHRTALDREACEFAVQMLRDQVGQPVHPCHRLDRPTSGVLLFALDKRSCSAVGRCFAAGQVAKCYHAIVRGWTDAAGHIDYPLRSEQNPEKEQSAQTDYTRLATGLGVATPNGAIEVFISSPDNPTFDNEQHGTMLQFIYQNGTHTVIREPTR
ncbi:MAG: hypothetical protein EA353_01940 [Puniceicoccaceae bacterium]|nr:MAG: hypothetical protein EA353_01940 [Puniceicoccaceae bacterium]